MSHVTCINYTLVAYCANYNDVIRYSFRSILYENISVRQCRKKSFSARWLATFTLWGPLCSICREIEIPLMARIAANAGPAHAFSRLLSPPSCVRRPLLKAFECNGQLTTVFAIHRAGLIAYRARSRRSRNNSYAFSRPAFPSFRVFPWLMTRVIAGREFPPRPEREGLGVASRLLLTFGLEGYEGNFNVNVLCVCVKKRVLS